MKNYEILSENCKIAWREDAVIGNAKYTQVSGYVLNEQGQLLIVKNQNTWTIPGGHPEVSETKEETLKRELMEEAYITLKDIHYLGAVEVYGEDFYIEIQDHGLEEQKKNNPFLIKLSKER